jgi:hypothetical protein
MHHLLFWSWRGILLRLVLSGRQNNSSFVGNILWLPYLPQFQSCLQTKKEWRVRIKAGKFQTHPK